jgi:RNA polymerase sigma-70 factor (ECF subfamily)
LNDEMRLIRAIQKSGDRAAADTLIRGYYDEIYRFLRKQTSDGDAALDLTQEVFISLLRTIGRYDPKKGAGFRTWLYKIATDKTIDYYRSRSARKSQTLSLDDIEPIDESDFTRRIENRDFAERVCEYVNTLPPDTQKIFRLHIFGEYTFAEIAAQMNMPENSVKTKYYRLIGALRKEFGGHE